MKGLVKGTGTDMEALDEQEIVSCPHSVHEEEYKLIPQCQTEKGRVSMEHDSIGYDGDQDHIHGDWTSLGCFLATMLYHVATEHISTQAILLRDVLAKKSRPDNSVKYISLISIFFHPGLLTTSQTVERTTSVAPLSHKAPNLPLRTHCTSQSVFLSTLLAFSFPFLLLPTLLPHHP
jgi:hypothetical protein